MDLFNDTIYSRMNFTFGKQMVPTVMSATEQRKLLMGAKLACYFKMMEYEKLMAHDDNDDVVCGVAWDDILCWEPAPVNTLATQPCPAYVSGFNMNENATRFCTENGTWYFSPKSQRTWTNFSACSKTMSSVDLKFHSENAARLRLMYSIGYSLSLAALVVAVFIMVRCRKMHSKSNTLHVNLFISFIFRASISFLKDVLFRGVGLDIDVRQKEDGFYEFLDGPHWQCKLLFVVFNYVILASIMWIFVEGLYLHILLYKPLLNERRGVKAYVVLGWVMPLVLLIPWVTVKWLYENTYCWNIQHDHRILWILKGPGVAVVIINFISFIDVSRMLCTRARQSKTVAGKAKYRKLAKFILVLIPLFGVTYIIFLLVFPSRFKGKSFNVAYMYMEMAYNSFQGLVLAILFCFMNEEVLVELKRLWRRNKSRRHDRNEIRRSMNSWKRRSRSMQESERRKDSHIESSDLISRSHDGSFNYDIQYSRPNTKNKFFRRYEKLFVHHGKDNVTMETVTHPEVDIIDKGSDGDKSTRAS